MRSGGAGQGGYVRSFVCGGQNEPAQEDSTATDLQEMKDKQLGKVFQGLAFGKFLGGVFLVYARQRGDQCGLDRVSKGWSDRK